MLQPTTNSDTSAPTKPNTWPYWFTAAAIYMAIAPLGEVPHLLGKLRWVSGGAVGMAALDWWDLAIHGIPIVVMCIYWLYVLTRRLRPNTR